MTVDHASPKSIHAAIRSIRLFLNRVGYKRGMRKGSVSYRLKEEIQLQRDLFVSRMHAVDKEANRRIISMDESYIHQNHARHEDSLYDPNDEQNLMVRPRYKGRCYCFIAAISDADNSIPNDSKTRLQEAHLIKETLDVFQGGKQTKDYHGMFNYEYFVQWLRKLLDYLRDQGIHNTIIIMDNAKYHKRKPFDTPQQSSKKCVLQEACAKYGVPYDAEEPKSLSWAKLSEYTAKYIEPIIRTMAKEEGHEVLFSPPIILTYNSSS